MKPSIYWTWLCFISLSKCIENIIRSYPHSGVKIWIEYVFRLYRYHANRFFNFMERKLEWRENWTDLILSLSISTPLLSAVICETEEQDLTKVLFLKPCSAAQFAHGCILHPRVNSLPLKSRLYVKKMGPKKKKHIQLRYMYIPDQISNNTS